MALYTFVKNGENSQATAKYKVQNIFPQLSIITSFKQRESLGPFHTPYFTCAEYITGLNVTQEVLLKVEITANIASL
jgi:hypothetical protein